MATATFSVVIPTHDDGSNVLEAIDSVRSQTLQDFELIVVDDGSTDDTQQLLSSVDDPRLTIVRQDRRGVSAARNAGAAAATGRFLTFLDSDDIAHEDWLESLAAELRQDGVGIVCAGARVVHRSTGEVVRTALPAAGGPLFQGREVLFLAGTFAVERSLFAEAGGYVEELKYSENTEVGIRLVKRCLDSNQEIRTRHRPLLDYRVRSEKRSARGTAAVRRERSLARLEAVRFFFRHHGQLLRKNAELQRTYLTLGGVSAAHCGHVRAAARFLAGAIRRKPLHLESYLRLAYLVHPGIKEAIRGRFSSHRPDRGRGVKVPAGPDTASRADIRPTARKRA